MVRKLLACLMAVLLVLPLSNGSMAATYRHPSPLNGGESAHAPIQLVAGRPSPRAPKAVFNRVAKPSVQPFGRIQLKRPLTVGKAPPTKGNIAVRVRGVSFPNVSPKIAVSPRAGGALSKTIKSTTRSLARSRFDAQKKNAAIKNIRMSPLKQPKEGVVSASQLRKPLQELFQNGRIPKATELREYAKSQGWKPARNENGPLSYVDSNGVKRLTIKQGSSRAPGSATPHVEMRNPLGQRIDSLGRPTNRKSIENHTAIEYDL